MMAQVPKAKEHFGYGSREVVSPKMGELVRDEMVEWSRGLVGRIGEEMWLHYTGLQDPQLTQTLSTMIPPPEIHRPIMPRLVPDGLQKAVGYCSALLSLPTYFIGLPFIIAECKARHKDYQDHTYSWRIFGAPFVGAVYGLQKLELSRIKRETFTPFA
eukprot:CAMPEP_0175945936 /NCGR_PEP_ID=MMETSP0108-20121206/27007_1 /TAXON_ID=195067 ORGANISM="Goniomonas pacifica, Strain CCMP1869" /NCGR_SAMPLE_ID=MMETSP0108 /ASSEMBLY_ACC=CAM_ASM_000204 /LENGTH=157 /DNA_ID=CAMNT_0017271311 /DNA_START=1 /DNA_END=471 /DNA_ORIENTATION=-